MSKMKCQCGAVELSIDTAPIVRTECYCTDCQKAGAMLDSLPGAPGLLNANGGTWMVLYRKDKVHCSIGASHLKEMRLSPDSKTRRVVTTCCNSAMFLDFTGGHWVSLYGARLEDAKALAPQMRIVTGEAPSGAQLDDTIPNYKTHSKRFIARLMLAWAAMGFRTPKIGFVEGSYTTESKKA